MNKLDFENFFNFTQLNDIYQEKLPTMLVFGIQQLAEYSFFSPFKTHDHESVQAWQDLVIKQLENHVGTDVYHLVDTHDMLGNLLMIFALKEHSHKISDIFHDSVKYGFMNKVAEFGSVQIHFKYMDKDFCFLNVYLPPGEKNLGKRLDAINQIHKQAFQKEGVGKYKKMKLEDNDMIIMFGDFNSRINMKNQDIRDLMIQAQQSEDQNVQKQNIQKLVQQDEFFQVANQMQKHYQEIKAYHEPAINQLPTFRGSNTKQISPAWKQRSFLRINNENDLQMQEKGFQYKYIDQYRSKIKSAHKPVGCKINLKIKAVDQKQSDEKLLELLHARKTLLDNDLDYLIDVFNTEKKQIQGFNISNSSNQKNTKNVASQKVEKPEEMVPEYRKTIDFHIAEPYREQKQITEIPQQEEI